MSVRFPGHFWNPRGQKKALKRKKYLKHKGEKVYGLNGDDGVLIEKDMSAVWQGVVQLHELCHEACRFPVLDPEGAPDLEEIVVETLSINLASMWQQNPKLFRWLHWRFTGEEL